MTLHRAKPLRNSRRGPSGQQEKINLLIRKQIRSGIFPPGFRLPPRTEFEKDFQAAPATIQAVFDKLIADGFVRAEGQRGTFIADHPPCLSNYAIVFPVSRKVLQAETRFWNVLAQVAEDGQITERNFSLYADVNEHTDVPDYARLLADLHSQRLAGVIFASSPHLMERTPLFARLQEQTELPKVAFMAKNSYPDIPAICSKIEDFIPSLLDHFHFLGCKRLGVLGILTGEFTNQKLVCEEALFAEAARRGVQLLEEHVQVMHPALAHRVRPLAKLMLRGEPASRPDALLILDDSLVEAATLGALDADRVPEDLSIAAYCNFPYPPPVAMPVTSYGLDVREMLNRCLQIIDTQKEGGTVPKSSKIPLQFFQPEEVASRNKVTQI